MLLWCEWLVYDVFIINIEYICLYLFVSQVIVIIYLSWINLCFASR